VEFDIGSNENRQDKTKHENSFVGLGIIRMHLKGLNDNQP